MCGIVYNYNFGGESAANRVLKQFKKQIHRGTTSYGFALPDKHVNNWKIKYDDIAKALRRTTNPEILFHHRLSTSTEDRLTACHPFSTKDVFKTEFVGVHNGMLWNEHELYEKHKERFGIRYVSDNGKDFNDSEAYVYDLASYFSGMTEGIEMGGYGAFILVEYDKKTKRRLRLHWGTTDTSSAPLRVHHTQKHLDITSEGKGWMVEKDVHYVYDYESGDITSSPLVHLNKITSKYSPYYNSTYYGSHYDDDDYVQPKSSPSSSPTLGELADYAIDGDYDDYEVITKAQERHYGWSLYIDGCCEVCDRRMEESGDFSELFARTERFNAELEAEMKQIKTSAEAVIVQRAIDKSQARLALAA